MRHTAIEVGLHDAMGHHDAMFFFGFLPIWIDYSPSAGNVQCIESPIDPLVIW